MELRRDTLVQTVIFRSLLKASRPSADRYDLVGVSGTQSHRRAPATAGNRFNRFSWLNGYAHGWFAFFCTDPDASVVEILEAFADRATIEQDYHDVKEVWGEGQQQVRNIWINLAVYNLNMWMHTLVELWAWDRSGAELLRSKRLALGRCIAATIACELTQGIA